MSFEQYMGFASSILFFGLLLSPLCIKLYRKVVNSEEERRKTMDLYRRLDPKTHILRQVPYNMINEYRALTGKKD